MISQESIDEVRRVSEEVAAEREARLHKNHWLYWSRDCDKCWLELTDAVRQLREWQHFHE